MKPHHLALAVALAGGLTCSHSLLANEWNTLIEEGKFFGDFRLRYEQNDVDNASKTADALTLRSRIGIETGQLYGFSALLEGVNTSALIDDYAPESQGYNTVGDPASSAFNRVQLNYQHQRGYSAVLGRQRIILNNARMVGNVGWRQHEQTYDAARLGYKKEQYQVDYAYINQVNTPAYTSYDAKHHLLNLSYSGLPVGTLTGYAILFNDEDARLEHDTYGVRLTGQQELDSLTVLYGAEYAQQKKDNFDAAYIWLEGGVQVAGITASLGLEQLGSDNKGYAFQTPLATKHAFNGWADIFAGATPTPNDGLDDRYVKLGTQLAGVNLLAFYHDYRAAKGGNDYGSEVNLQANKAFNEHWSAGVKYARYSQGDEGVAQDTNKAWAWLEARF